MIGRRGAVGRRGSLLGAAARTAVVAGTATAVGSRVAHRHRQHAEEQADRQHAEEQADRQHAEEQAEQPPAAAPAPADEPATGSGLPAGEDVLDQLERLAALRSQGMLDESEFAAAKHRLLGI